MSNASINQIFCSIMPSSKTNRWGSYINQNTEYRTVLSDAWDVGCGVLDSLYKSSCWKVIDAWMQGMFHWASTLKYKNVWQTYTSAFRFRNGKESQSVKSVDIPVLVPENKIVEQQVYIVNSGHTMTELDFTIDTERRKIKQYDKIMLYNKTEMPCNIECWKIISKTSIDRCTMLLVSNFTDCWRMLVVMIVSL